MTNHVNQDDCIRRLREAVETALGRKMQTPKDFKFLADKIFEKLHKSVSPTTLKRLWGYLSEPVIPRVSTLDILAQFVGFDSLEAFCQQAATTDNPVTSSEPPPTSAEAGAQQPNTADESPAQPSNNQANTHEKSLFPISRILFALVVLVIIVIAWFLYKYQTSEKPTTYVLTMGQKFETFQDYLDLFGIKDTAFYWGRPVPHHHNIAVWGPEYQHPRWHNYGDPEQMMPTITERWEPEGADSSLVAMRNFDNYNHELRVNEVRLTFMKNLVDSGYVFLGVYRMNIEQSDTTRCVWERVLEECDLRNLDYLETFRNNKVFPVQ